MKKLIVLALLASVLVVSPAFADDDDGDITLTHHVDLWQVGSDNAKVKAYDLSYHFTLIEIDRFNLLGAGFGFDMWSTCEGRRCDFDGSDRKYFGSPFLVVPLASIRLSKKSPDGSVSLGTNYVYHLRNDDHNITVGFMVTWQ